MEQDEVKLGIIENTLNEFNPQYSKQVEKGENKFLELARSRLKQCDAMDGFDTVLQCKSDLLYEVSEAQDIVNLNIRGDFFNKDPEASKDSRWEMVHLLDNANAVFLGVAKARYNPEICWREGDYVYSKAHKFCSRVRVLDYEMMLPEGQRKSIRSDIDRKLARERYGSE